MYVIDTQEEYATFSEKSRDFLSNPVTCIDVFLHDPSIVVVGYERGQLVLFDASEPKGNIKALKESHKGKAVTTVRFLDHKPVKENKDIWMFCSIDN